MSNSKKEIPDELNPEFIFQLTATELLVNALNEKIDIKELIKKELSGRGLDDDGVFVGFKK